MVSGNPHGNRTTFFEENPEARFFRPCKRLIKEYGEERASELTWAAYMYCDPSSMYYSRQEDIRQMDISEEYLEDESFDWDDIKDLTESWSRCFLDKGEIQFKIWMDKMEQGTVWLKEQSFDTDAKGIWNLLKDVEKYWASFEKVQQKFNEIRESQAGRGGIEAGGLSRIKEKYGGQD